MRPVITFSIIQENDGGKPEDLIAFFLGIEGKAVAHCCLQDLKWPYAPPMTRFGVPPTLIEKNSSPIAQIRLVKPLFSTFLTEKADLRAALADVKPLKTAIWDRMCVFFCGKRFISAVRARRVGETLSLFRIGMGKSNDLKNNLIYFEVIWSSFYNLLVDVGNREAINLRREKIVLKGLARER